MLRILLKVKPLAQVRHLLGVSTQVRHELLQVAQYRVPALPWRTVLPWQVQVPSGFSTDPSAQSSHLVAVRQNWQPEPQASHLLSIS